MSFDEKNEKSIEDFANKLYNMRPHEFNDSVVLPNLKKSIDCLNKMNKSEYNGTKPNLLIRIIINITCNYHADSVIECIITNNLLGCYKKMIEHYMNLDENYNQLKLESMRRILGSIINVLNSDIIAEENLKNGFLKMIIDYTRYSKLLNLVKQNNEEALNLYDNIILFIYNNSKYSILKEELVNLNIIDCIIEQKTDIDSLIASNHAAKNELEIIKTRLASILAFVLTDDQLNTMSVSEEIVSILVNILNKTIVASKTNPYINGTKFYYQYEMGTSTKHIYASNNLANLYRLSINDTIKKIIYEKNAIPLLETFLKEGSDSEQAKSAEFLCSLSFNTDALVWIRDNVELMKLIKAKAEKSKIKAIVNSCKQIIEMANRKFEKRLTSAKVNQRVKAVIDQHIMISYNHSNQEQCKTLNELLKSKGYKTWIDYENVLQDLHESMAHAVESASVILICYSESYKNSNNCRLEAQYALDRLKPIIPIRMQAKFRPDGWLGLLIGGKFYVDLSNSTFKSDDPLVSELFKHIETKIHGHGSENVYKTSVTNVSSLPSIAKPVVGDRIKEWKTTDIVQWLTKNNYQDVIKVFDEYDGFALMALYEMKHKDYSRFCDTMDNEFKEKKIAISLPKKLKLYQLLEDLFSS